VEIVMLLSFIFWYKVRELQKEIKFSLKRLNFMNIFAKLCLRVTFLASNAVNQWKLMMFCDRLYFNSFILALGVNIINFIEEAINQCTKITKKYL